jgi:AcrR family transcriptional regulator
MSTKATRTKIMDVAELLFSEHGYDGVSISDITMAASLQKSIISYHFGSKQGLWEAVFARRADALATERLLLLDHCHRQPGGPTVESLIEAFIRPMFDLNRNNESRSYARLVAQSANAAHPLAVAALEMFNPVAKRFIAAFQAIMPTVSEERVVLAFSFMLGTMMLSLAQTGRVEGLSDGRVNGNDLDLVSRHLLSFVAAGMRALAAEEVVSAGAGD